MQTSLMLNLRSLIHCSFSLPVPLSLFLAYMRRTLWVHLKQRAEREERKKITDHKKEHFEIQKFAYGTFQSGKCVLRGHESKMKE